MKKYRRSAYTDNAHGGCRKRAALNVAEKVARSANGLLRGIGKGLLHAVKVWTDSAPARGGW
jgi:hypothetical protein